MAKILTILTILFTVGIGQMWGADTWKLVTSVSDLAVDDEVVIVASSANYALSTTQNNNNRGQASVTKNTSDKTVSWTSSSTVQVLTIKAGTSSGTFAFYTGSGYLYAASSSSNYLRTQTTNNANGSWNISITSNGVATIKATGSNSKNWLRYNSNSSIFSCYSSGQGDVCIYKKAATCTKPTISWATAPTDGNVGETMTASVSTNYSDGLSYSSSNTSVATIDNSGKITYKAAGTTIITASVTGDGTTYCSETVSVTQKITVSKSCTSITPSLSYAPATIVVGETTSPTLTGNTGNGTVTYSSNKTSVATVDASTGTVTAKSAGTATITANIATNGDYCAGSATFEITVNKKSATITLSEAGSTSNPSGTFYIGDSYTLPSSDATCDGKEFVGWSTEQIQTPTDNPTATIHAAGTNVTLAETNTFYAVFATVGEPEGTTTEEVTRTYIFSKYTAGTQYASNEEHILDDDVTIYTTNCHFTTQLRIYSSSNNGYVVSNQLPGQIVSIGMNAGNKVDEVLVYGSSDGSTWKQVGSISVTSTSYKDYILSFGDTDYTYFKLDVKGSNQVRLQSLTITWETSAASNEPTYSQYTTSCSGKTGTTLTWSADKYLTTINGDTNFPTLTTSPADLTGVTYSSSNTSVATINATTGAITVIGLGETTITASYAGNDTYDAATDATYTLTVADIFTISYAVGNGDTAPDNNTVVQGNKVTLPNLNTTLNCVSFVGWTDAQNGYNHGTSQLYKAGAEYTPTATITLHAVYGVGAGYVLVEDVATLTVGMQVIIANTDAAVAMGEDKGNNRAQVSVTIEDKTLTPAGGVEIFTLEDGTTAGTFALKASEGYIYAASSSSNYLKTQTTKDANGSWKITITNGVASIIAQGSNSRKMMQYNSSSNLFACYATTTTNQKPVSLYAQGIANYTTDPECMTYSVTTCTPSNGTIAVDNAIVDPYGSTTVTFTPASGYMLQTVTVTSGTADVGTPSYTTSQISGGTVKITNIQSDIEVCATFVEIPYYKVTFVDMNNGNSTQIVSQSGFGADIQAPTTASDGCDATWTFIGWAPNNSLNGASEIPSGLVAPGGTISGSLITDNSLTYYSVYSNSSDGTPPFSIGKSGTYFMYALSGSTKYYATTNRNGNALYAGEEESNDFNTYPKAKVKLTYNSNTNKYKIQITTFGNNPTDGYLYHPDATKQDITHNSLENYTEFTLQNGSASGYNIVYNYTVQQLQGNVYVPVVRTGCFGKSNSYFNASTTITDVYFEPASEMHYYNASDCPDDYVTMSFHNPFVESGVQLTYEDGYEEDYYRNTSKKYVDVFPTLEYAGWTFIGWTAGSSYNYDIGEENLNDENSSASAPTQDIYKTGGGLSYYLDIDVTMYPVFTKFEDNEPFDMVNGGDYYMYYIADGDIGTSVDEYGVANRIYAGAWESGGTSDSYGATQSCASATLFTFTKLSNGKWSIYDNTKGRYLCAGASDNNLALNTTTATYGEWTITVHNGNQVNAVSKDGYTLSAYSQDAVTGTFKNYATSNFNNNSAYYHRVYVGTCTERVYSSNPTNKPAITLSGEPIVTSTQDQSIRAQGELSISATKLAANGTITLTADNADVYFSTVKDANFTQATKPLASLTLNADEKGKLATTTVYVHYKPTSTSSLGVQTANITATTGTNGQPDYATATTTAALRNLPANFVIAAKWGDNWYAMPANMDSQSSTEGWLIEVDDAANPTKAIAAPNTTKYGLKSVYTSNSTDDRFENYGERLVFVENVNEATPVANKTLYNGGDASSSKTNIQVYAQYKTATGGYYSTNPDRYEWIPTTTDLTDYTLTSGAILTGDAVGRTVSLDNHGVFGTLLQDKSYNGMVRLLPVDNFYAPAELQVVEWKQNSVSVMYTGAGTKYTTKVGNNAESSAQTLSAIDHAVYSLSTTDLTTATNQPLIITIKDDADVTIGAIKLTVPAIVSENKGSTELSVTAENAKATNIVILDGATLTAGTTKYTYNDVVVYPGGKLVIEQSGTLGMYTLTLRAGSSWGAAEYEHKYPQFLLKGDYSNSSGQINLDYVTTQDYYYPLSVPEEVTIGDIKYPVDIYGSNVEKANKGSFRLKYYDGAQRVEQGSQYGTGWIVVNEKETTTLTPNQGYAIWGIPKKINGTRQTYGIHRIPMKIAAGTLATNEKTNAEVQITAYGDASTPPNDRGWNYLGNPYLAQLGGMNGDDPDLQIGKLEQEKDANGDWTGGWVYNGDNIRYITVTNDCQTFEAKPVAEAQIPSFTTFFIQAASVDDQKILLTAPASVSNVSSLPARHYAAQQETAKEITTGIILTGNDQTDRTGLLIADNFTEEYDFNADLSKFENSGINLYTIGKDGKLAFMAINQALAEQPIPLGYSAPTDGEYTIAFDEDRYNVTDISALYLIDYDRNETTNLLHTDYSFVTTAGTNNERFALQVAFIPQNATSVEWVDDATIQVAVDGNNLLLNNLPTDAGVQVFDALGRVIYATPNAPTEMQITLPTGYYLVRIADKQHAVVINTVIP